MEIFSLEAIFMHAGWMNMPKKPPSVFWDLQEILQSKGTRVYEVCGIFAFDVYESSNLKCCLYNAQVSLRLDDSLVMSLHVNRLSLLEASIPGVLMFY